MHKNRPMPQTAIPCLFMRGGTSRGPFFKAADLPADTAARDRVLLAVMGSPDARQIDGLGGAHPLTSKVGIVSPGSRPGVDLDFLFAQLQPDRDTVDTTPNCGNMLAAVVPFALETGMVAAHGETTTLRVLTLNTDMQCDITVSTPGRLPGETMPTLLVSGCAPPRPSICRASGEPMTASSTRSRSATSAGRSATSKNGPREVPPRMNRQGMAV